MYEAKVDYRLVVCDNIYNPSKWDTQVYPLFFNVKIVQPNAIYRLVTEVLSYVIEHHVESKKKSQQLILGRPLVATDGLKARIEENFKMNILQWIKTQ